MFFDPFSMGNYKNAYIIFTMYTRLSACVSPKTDERIFLKFYIRKYSEFPG
jgi:hypothetical protein